MTHVTVTMTIDTRASANQLAQSAVEARLAACGQVLGPIVSAYRWRGEVETAEEWMVVFKTTAKRYPDLEAHLRGAHPYEVPEIVAVPVCAGNPDYLAWVTAETAPPVQPSSASIAR